MIDMDSYLMGVFDGEGSICAVMDKRNRLPSVQISLAMVDAEVVALFMKRWGGRLHEKNYGKRPQLLWQLRKSAEQIPFLEAVAAGSIVKKRQAELVLPFVREIAERASKSPMKGRRLSDRAVEDRQNMAAELRLLNYHKTA